MKQLDFNKSWSWFREKDTKNAEIVNLPHDAQLREQRSQKETMDSGFFPGGKYVYTKKYNFPAELSDQAVYLEFDGVYRNAEVWVNGQKAASWHNGYRNSFIPIHDFLKCGHENEIRVIADNSQFPNSRWYTGAGIFRNVTMHIGNARHVRPDAVRIRTLSYMPAVIEAVIDRSGTEDCTVKTDILLDGRVVASGEGFETQIKIPEAKLWDEENPNLYVAHVQLFYESAIVDEAYQTFGIRFLEWDAEFGLKVNGREVLLRGGCIHHDNGILGAAAWTDAEERKVRLLKQAGFNALRSSHNVCSTALLEACDKYGMYMMDEFADMWIQHKHKYDYACYFKECYEQDLCAMVSKDYNHPSVIMYSIGNEVSETAMEEGLEYARKMTELVHRLDKSRPVTCGVNLLLNGLASMGRGLYQEEGMVVDQDSQEKTSGSTFVNNVMGKMGGIINYVGRMKKFDLATKEIFQILDIAGYNYGAGRYKADPKQYPKRITVGSETLPPSLYKNWEAVKKYPNLTGDFMWTAWDYLGEAGLGVVGYGTDAGKVKKYPSLISGCGLVDITGEYRPEIYWAQCIWGLRDTPYLAVNPVDHAGEKPVFSMWRNSDARHSWAWPGLEGKKTDVTVYTSAYRVELICNGKKIGSRKVKECKATFTNVTYMSGELKAVAYYADGRKAGEDTLRSAENGWKLQLEPEQEQFRPGHLLYVNIYLVDKNGTRIWGNDRKISVEVEGGDLIGLGSANPLTKESYLDKSFTSYNGMVQAIIMPDENTKQIRISASSVDMEKNCLCIRREK